MIGKELQKALDAQPGTAYFNWDGSTWCLSGTTVDGNYWETDDMEAGSEEEAETAAINHLLEAEEVAYQWRQEQEAQRWLDEDRNAYA